ncbi:outer membrane beta-barrel protein [Chitinophaga pollutisoli]|uniref:Outer membrane beta-barrel protein n=1 Tax=Chitinophaga pollutisoli TaxID=3133966 RepID=A0ABZ2YKG3_9BACT
MYRNAIVVFLCLFCFTAVAQQRTEIKGAVADSASSELLEMATITAQDPKDSSLITYTLSDKKGAFRLTGLPAGKPVRVLVSYTGYRTWIQIVGTDRSDLGRINLAPAPRELGVVEVAGNRPPITIRKDTIEFNADAFKTRPNAVVEELLKKLPGVDIDQDGKITVNGKPVSRIMVDGRDFFGGDSKIALKNLPTHIIDKVQVSDTKTKIESKMGIEKDGEDKTINFTLKPDKKKGLFGRITGGYGTDERYDASGMLSFFNGARQISVLGSSNNLNKMGFSVNEVMSAAPMRGGSMTVSAGSGGMSVNGISFGGGGEGIRTGSMVGVNYNDEWTKDMKSNTSYQFNNTHSKFNTISENRYNDGRSVLGNRGGYGRNQSHNISLNMEYQLDSVTILSVAPRFSNTRQSSNTTSEEVTYRDLDEKANERNGRNISKNDQNSFSLDLNAMRTLNKKGRSISLRFRGDYGNNSGNAFNYSDQQFFVNNLLDSTNILDQRSVTSGRNESYDLGITYVEPISERWRMNFGYSFRHGINNSSRETFNFDELEKGYNEFDSLYSNRFNNKQSTHSPTVNFQFSNKKKTINATIGGGVLFNSLENLNAYTSENFRQEQTNFNPNTRINWTMPNKGQLSFSYNAHTQQPSIEQLQPVPDNSNPLNIRLGNPDLKTTFSQMFNIGYNKFSPKGFGMFSNIGYRPVNNSMSTYTKVNSDGSQVTQTINVDGVYNFNGHINLSYNKVKKDYQFRVNGGAFGNYSNNVNYSNINNVRGDTAVHKNVSKNLMLGPNVNASFSWKELLDLTLNYRPSYSQVTNNRTSVKTSNFSQRANAGGTLYWPKNFFIENDLAYNYNANIAPGFKKGVAVYSAAIGYEFMNRAANLKLYGYDLFRQNTNIRRMVTELGTFDTRTDMVDQYFMLSFTYNFAKFGSKIGSNRRRDGARGMDMFMW